MNVIDTLYTVFKLDKKDFEAGIKSVDKDTRQSQKTMTDAEKAADLLSEKFVEMAKTAAEAALALVSVHHIAHEFAEIGQQAIHLKTLSDATGLSMQAIQEWGHATVETGGTVEQFNSSLENLGNSLNDIRMTGESAISPVLRFMGIVASPGNIPKVNDLLLTLSDRFAKMDAHKALDVGKRLGLDQGTIYLLMKGRKAVEELLEKKKEISKLDEKNREDGIKLNVMMDEMRAVFEEFYIAVGSTVLPVIIKLAEGFMTVVDFLKQHKPFLFAFLAGLTALWWEDALAAGSAAVAMIAAAAPVIALAALFIALAAAIAFVVDDLWNFAEGNDSVIGAVLGKWKELVKWFEDKFPRLSKIVKAAFDFMLAPLQAFIDTLNMAIEGWKMIGQLGMKAASAVFGASEAPTNSVNTTNIAGGNSKTVTNNIRATANVHTQATDAIGVSKHVNSTMAEQLRSAVSQADDGVDA